MDCAAHFPAWKGPGSHLCCLRILRRTLLPTGALRGVGLPLVHARLEHLLLKLWVAELHAAQDAGEFLFAETAFLVTAAQAR